ncbi:MAG: Kazal-type serine protease inhibitor domain-containing protein, partial [Hyphomicrobiales bacterium]
MRRSSYEVQTMIRQVIVATVAFAMGVAAFAGLSSAQAPQYCPSFDKPVCGRAKGQKPANYRNACIASQNSARVLYEGNCKKRPRRAACTRDYKPVCGRVGSRKAITYANSCVAKTNGARVLHKGRCRRTSGCAKT